MDDSLTYFIPSDIAMLLGKSSRDVRNWQKEGLLRSTLLYGRNCSSEKDISEFLHDHPEEIGRVYCDDLIPFFNEARAQIVTLLEQLNEVANTWEGYQSTSYQNS